MRLPSRVFLLGVLGCGRAPEPCDVHPWLTDVDGDGFGAVGTEIAVCVAPPGWVREGGDCDDADPGRHPGVDEVCDRIDQDCDGTIDDDPVTPLFADLDGDGFGDPDAPVPNCDAWTSSDPSDCDDTDAERHPGTVWFVDVDADGVGAGAPQGTGCEPPGPDLAPTDGDCDDTDATVFPEAPELCDGRDQDCDGAVEGADAWAFAGLGVRIPLAVGPAVAGPIVVDLDFGGALVEAGIDAAFDPASVRAAVSDCGGPIGTVALPVQFVDGAAGLLELGSDADPIADGHGAVVIGWDLDGDPATTEAFPASEVAVAVYFHGEAPASAWNGDLEATASRLRSGPLEATFSWDAGGLLASLVYDGSPSLARQVNATNGNGVYTPGGPMSAQDVPGSVAVLESGPVTAAVRSTGHVENTSGGFDFAYTYRMFAGRSELWVTPSFRTTSALPVEGDPDRTSTMRPFQSRWLLDEPRCTSDPGLAWADASDDRYGLTWVWAVPPAFVTHLECTRPETWTAANDYRPCCEGATGIITTATDWVDHPVLVLLPHGPGGPESVEGLREARIAGVPVTVGVAERP